MNGKHHTALPFKDVAKFIAELRASQLDKATKLSFELLILTAARTTEVRSMVWSEVDVEAKLWTPGKTYEGARAARCAALRSSN